MNGYALAVKAETGVVHLFMHLDLKIYDTSSPNRFWLVRLFPVSIHLYPSHYQEKQGTEWVPDPRILLNTKSFFPKNCFT